MVDAIRHEARPGLRILMYHAVGSRLPHDSYGISIRPERFERHMVLLATADACVVSLGERGASTAGLRVAVTFDDGYSDNLHTAAPILARHGIPFTVFVSTAFVDEPDARYLSRPELRDLAEVPGATIGSHGATHVPLTTCDDAALWNELHDSRCYLEDILGKAVTVLSYPHGDVDARVREAAERAGYLVGACSHGDINADTRDPLLLGRTEIVASDSTRIFLQKLRGAWDWYRWRHLDPART